MPKVIIARAARDDLIDIWSYIAVDNLSAADRTIDKIVAKMEMLARNPQLGRTRDELGIKLRSFPVGNFLIVYRTRRNGITVARVIHAARNLEHLF